MIRYTPWLASLIGAALIATACGETPSYLEKKNTKSYTPPSANANGQPDGGDAGGPHKVGGAGGEADSGAPDSGAPDSGAPDAGTPDAGDADGGAEAGDSGGDADGGAEAGDTGDAGGTDGPKLPPGLEDPIVLDKLKRLPKFGLLVNDLECGLCHVAVVGDVLSTRRVPPLWQSSNAVLTGRWLAAAQFDAATPESPAAGSRGQGVTVAASGGVHPNYRGPEMPLDTNMDGAPDFPAIPFDTLAAKMRGTVQVGGTNAAQVAKVHNGNLVLVGTQQAPILVKDDILVTGDLVIKGYYTGTGSIYVQGNIYIPADLKALRTAFPYSNDDGQALAEAQEQVLKQSTDALGLATKGSIFIGDLEKHQNSDAGNEALNVYNHPATPANRQGPALGVLNVFNWFPGGRTAFDALYERAISCETQQATQIGSFNMVEAFLYARNTVAGISRRASFSIRGGVIADYFHVVSGASRCGATPSPVHGRPGNKSYIEYDFRLRTGLLRILEHAAEAFPKGS